MNKLLMYFKWYRKKHLDQIVWLKDYGDVYKPVESEYFDAGTKDDIIDKENIEGKYPTPKESNMLNRWGNWMFFMDIESGKQLSLEGEATPISPEEFDLLTQQSVWSALGEAAMGEGDRDLLALILALVAGIGLGWIIQHVFMVYA